MKIVLQRVSSAKVDVNKHAVGSIWVGLILFVWIGKGDTKADVEKMVKKIVNLRIFEDEHGKMNRSIIDIGGEILSISQFTLWANCKKWNRPSFTDAECPENAKLLWEYTNEKIRESLGTVETGIFGADMKVSLENDGPVTIILDSREL